ncbi:hypothetical protein FSP39_002580 [Pinctada imbricata]|uniref:Uncharacterized protein n=1 Tax=Pinctada imbricata TaxID=66713 RepID=A0AA88XCL7_PINIB|nr:hypothetical protein FSP39_002580 [Pinctada imbricata]
MRRNEFRGIRMRAKSMEFSHLEVKQQVMSKSKLLMLVISERVLKSVMPLTVRVERNKLEVLVSQKRRSSILKNPSPQKLESFREISREAAGTPKLFTRRKKTLVPREKLWNKLSEVVDKRRVRFSKFVSVANEANKRKISPGTKDGKGKTRRLSMLAKPKKDFSVKGGEDSEVNNPKPQIIIESPEPNTLEAPGKREEVLKSPVPLRNIGSGLFRSRKNILDKFKSTSSKTWMIKAFDDIKHGSRSSQNVGASNDLEVRRGSDSLVQHGQQIFEIIDTINTQKKKRLKSDIEEEMINIHNRVKDALLQVDMYDEDEDLMKEAKGRLPPLSSLEVMKQRRERMYKEKAVTEEVEKFKGICKERAAVIAEVNQWLASKNLLDVLEDEVDIQKAGRYFQEVHGTIMTILHQYTEHSDKVLNLGNSLLDAAGAIIKENEENTKRLKEKQKEKIVVYDERQILADSVKWENAVKMVLNTFEDAMKWTKNNTYKYIYQKGQKQLKEINFATKKKLQELKEKTKQAADTKTVIPECVGRDSEYYKTLLSGMKRDFNAELEKLKSHLNKRGQGQAIGNIVREPRNTFPLALSSNYSILKDTKLVF